MTTVLVWLNVVALLGVGGAFTFFALIPFAMANDSPQCGPLVKYGFLQITAYAGLIVSLLFGLWVAQQGGDHDGWGSFGTGALGWGVWIAGVVVDMALFFGIGRLDMGAAAWWRRRQVGIDNNAWSSHD